MYNSGGGSGSAAVMDAALSAEQALLRDSTTRFIDEVCPLQIVRDVGALADDYLRRAADLGWFAMLVPDELGGGTVSGDGLVDAALLAEVRGAHVQPGLFIPMNIVALALARRGSERQRSEVLPAIVAGEHIATWALADPEHVLDGRGGVTATRTEAGWELNGIKEFVQDPQMAESFLVDFVTDGQLRQALVSARAPGVAVTPLESLDISMQMGRLELRGARITDAELVGTAESTHTDLDLQLDVAAVLCAAETVGAMDRLFEMTVQYARDRIAFGRPIGSFQAVKHQLADLSLTLEMSKAAVQAGVGAVAGQLRTPSIPSTTASTVASVTKAYVGDAAIQILQGCFQVFGGIGFTWEHDLHLYLRRASVNAVLYGTPTWHRERIVRLGDQ